MKIVIPGGTGQVGNLLARHFHSAGHAVTVLSRQSAASAPWSTVTWDGVNPGPWVSALEHSDVCINLAGRSVDCRYNPVNRRAIHDSRIQSTLLLQQVIGSLQHPPRVWLNASTATIYRHALDRPMDEASGELGGNEPGAPDTWNFSIDVAKGWEDAFFAAPTPRTRKVALRSAMTFSPDRGGVFDVFLRLVRCGLGGTQGSGSQYVSWIHEADFTAKSYPAPSISPLPTPCPTASSCEFCAKPGAFPSVFQAQAGCLRSALFFSVPNPNWC
jgi:uncharacterized protein